MPKSTKTMTTHKKDSSKTTKSTTTKKKTHQQKHQPRRTYPSDSKKYPRKAAWRVQYEESDHDFA